MPPIKGPEDSPCDLSLIRAPWKKALIFLQTQKPLVWEKVKFSDRFSFVNTSKVVHVVADDSLNKKEWQEFEW